MQENSQNQDTINEPKNNNHLKGVLFTFLLIGMIGVIGFLYLQNQKLNQRIILLESAVEIDQSIEVNSLDTIGSKINQAENTADLLEDWESYLGECNSIFLIPPNVEPYIDTEKKLQWLFPKGAIYPLMLSKIVEDDSIQSNELFSQSNAMYAWEKGGVGYVPAAVSVSCIKNTEKLTNVQLLNQLEDSLETYNGQDNSERMEASKYVVTNNEEVIKWGQSVIDLVVTQYFVGGAPSNQLETIIFATPEYLYEVSVLDDYEEDPFVGKTADQILNNLKFE